MTWTAPTVVRVDEPFEADERTMLLGYLNWGRWTLLVKCAGLTAEQLARRPVEPSKLSLLGLVRHATEVERTWLRFRFGGEQVETVYDQAFEDARAEQAEADYERLKAEWALADRAIVDLPLDHVYVSERWGRMTLRWCLQHMITEYARHNGHADLIRERIDGTTGV